jgi:hypothetical protein
MAHSSDQQLYLTANGTLSLTDPTCTIAYAGNSYVNWATFVAAFPTGKVNDLAFVIADQPGMWTVTNVQPGSNPIA